MCWLSRYARSTRANVLNRAYVLSRAKKKELIVPHQTPTPYLIHFLGPRTLSNKQQMNTLRTHAPTHTLTLSNNQQMNTWNILDPRTHAPTHTLTLSTNQQVNAWNILDLLIVAEGWSSYIPGMANVDGLVVLRMMRLLRVFRYMYKYGRYLGGVSMVGTSGCGTVGASRVGTVGTFGVGTVGRV